MTKEAYAIYMTVKKSTFYITGHDITLRSDHLPLNKFLKQMMLNNTINNWAMEIESCKINFIHIAGKDNVLVDMLSRLIDIDPDVELQPELKDYEFGHYAFETLPKARSKMVHEILTSLDGIYVCEVNITYNNSENSPHSVKLPLSNGKFSCLQDKDLKVRQLKQKVTQGQYAQFYFIKKGILYRSMVDNGHKFEAAVVPEDLIGTVLHLGHNQSGQSNTYQAQIHNLKLARQHIIEDKKLVPDLKISTGDLVLVRDHTSKLFMPKYKTDYHVIRVLRNKVEVKDNNCKMSWFHISDMKKNDMITKLICQLPDYDAFGHKGRLNFDPERVKDLR